MKSQIQNFVICLLFFSVLLNCKNDKKTADQPKIQESAETPTKNLISIVTRTMEFIMVDTIPSGWNTFKYENLSNETHFVVFEKLPEGITIDSSKAQVFPVFDKGMDLINKGETEAGFAAFDALPAWFFNVEFTGGLGLVSPRESATSTINLDAGRYLIECYVKMRNGKFHSVMGMAKEVIVSKTPSDVEEPVATVNVSISSENGIEFNPSISSGIQVFKVDFKDQMVHENFVGHDVHLVKLADNSNLEQLEAWMNWANPKGFIDPAPYGVSFLGGMQEMKAGDSGYFYANLSKGHYALLAEVPNVKSKKMLKQFQVID
jgi:hypothetical protein